MNGSGDGHAFLKELREKDRKRKPSFSDFTDFLEEKARAQGVPLDGQFELTPLCNFRCGMCYVHLTEAQMCRPLLTAAQWNDLITQACRKGMLRATLTGGECLTYPGFRAVYEHLESLGCEVEVFTNGALLNERWLEYFSRRPPAGIHITLYGDSEDAYQRVTGHRAFETVLGHIRAISEAGLPLRINVTPSLLLGEDVFGTIRLARELCRNVTVNAMLSAPRPETGRSEQVLDLDEDFYIRIMKYDQELQGIRIPPCPAGGLPAPGGPECGKVCLGLRCGGGRSGFNINWQGVMNPCNMLETVQAYPLEIGFEAAWRQINQAANNWPRASACEDCAYAGVCDSCAGRVLRFAEPGEWPHALCERTKRFVLQGVYASPDCE